MLNLHVFCPSYRSPELHLWRPGTRIRLHLRPEPGPSQGDGWLLFKSALDHQIDEPVRARLSDGPEDEPAVFERELPRLDDRRFPADLWLFEGASRVLAADPYATAHDRVRLHLRTLLRYREGALYLWDREAGDPVQLPLTDQDPFGPVWEVPLEGRARHFFHYKFVATDGQSFEPDLANRVWTAADGPELWTLSGARDALAEVPRRRHLRVHFRQELAAAHAPVMRLWQPHADFETEVPGEPAADGWTVHDAVVYTGFPYRARFWNPTLPEADRFEHEEAERTILCRDDRELWTLEGDRHLFEARPRADRMVRLRVAAAPPGAELSAPWKVRVWVNRARAPLAVLAAESDAALSFFAYPEVFMSFRLGCERGFEALERHVVRVPANRTELHRSVVLERVDVHEEAPPDDLFTDPPFPLERPGAYARDGFLRFALHAPGAARAQVVGDFTGWRERPLEMRSTRDGAYWWAQVPLREVTARLPTGEWHGSDYRFLLDGSRAVQDPAAGWVVGSSPEEPSRLVRHDAFAWSDEGWEPPTADHLVLYQVHPSRFTNRFQDLPPLDRVAREVEELGGFLRDLGVTALQLMPVNEFPGVHSWGYDPAFYYAVEGGYGGPDALKRLVDACHRNGLAVFLDVVFNHAGTRDNALWAVAPDTYFDGDTQWGSMINFDHPQCRHFFEQNLLYLHRNFHVDGFRLDHTHTILHSTAGDRNSFVREPGSGGGWEFLHGLRRALHEGGHPRCLLVAEHLPNEWSLTNYGGPMDAQWCDDFHDRLVDACRGWFVMPDLARALRLSHDACDDWYKVVNYPESHDEVGNANDRVANVAGFGQGLRMSKVAAAATLLARGIPMFFQGAEVAEHRQFLFDGQEPLDVAGYVADEERLRVRAFWSALLALRRGNQSLQGPAPLTVLHAPPDGQVLAFARGEGPDYVAVLNFGPWSGSLPRPVLGLPDGPWRPVLDSTWAPFAVEGEPPGGGEVGDDVPVAAFSALVLARP